MIPHEHKHSETPAEAGSSPADKRRLRDRYTDLRDGLRRKVMPLWLFWIIVSLLYVAIITLSEFHGVPVSDFYSFLTTGMQFGVIALCTSGLLMLLASNRIVFAIGFPILALVSGVMCYFNLTIGTRLTPVAIELAMVNGVDMWWSMISGGVAAAAAGSLIIAVALAVVRWRCVRASRRMELGAAAVGVIVGLLPPAVVAPLRAPLRNRLPYSIFYATRSYLLTRTTIEEERHTYDSVSASAAPDAPEEVIFVIGETLRADHLPQNGYSRNTMPLLSRLSNVVSFRSVYTPYYHTDISVPHLLTDSDSINSDAAYTEQSFITLFRNAGYRTAWVANQDISRSYAYFAHEPDTLIYCDAQRSFYSYEKWLDRDILPSLQSWLDEGRRGGRKGLAVVHTIGSHWWYKSHYEDEHARFRPEVSHKDVGGLSREEMINSYDNTIIATDEFLYRLYEMIGDRNAVILFISDHGEALGEDGLYLHATDCPALRYPACMAIFTDSYARSHPEAVRRLKENAARHFTTASMFHSILDLADISTAPLDTLKSIRRGSPAGSKPSQSAVNNQPIVNK